MDRKNIFAISVAYLGVVLIWSTTPLAIKWSGEDVGFLFGISLRMMIGATLALLLTFIMFKKLPLHRQALAVYMAAGLAIFGAMLPVYWGAQYISSGLISVVFGLTPMVTALLAARLLNEQSLTGMKIIGALCGVIGLLLIFSDQIKLGDYAAWGIAAVLLSVLLHSASSVIIKRLDAQLPALIVTTGGLVFSLPLFLIVYSVFVGELPAHMPLRALGSIVYLGVMGSVVGFVSYYFLLARLQTSTVALITLITPVTALWVGYAFNSESLGVMVVIGSSFVLFGLIVHQWGGRLSG